MARLKNALVVALAAFAAACSPPKYVNYVSVRGDWRSSVPWHWNVMTDQEAGVFASTNLIGGFDPDFYLGAPSFSVRWHAYKRAHTLPNGLIEYYSDADDYIKQMLKRVYGPDYHLVDERDASREAPIGELRVAGRVAKHFIVLSAVTVPESTHWGTEIDPETNKTVVVRRHEYVVVPEEKGFYVLVYPATLGGYDKFKPEFNNLVRGFTILKQSPFDSATTAVAAGRRASP